MALNAVFNFFTNCKFLVVRMIKTNSKSFTKINQAILITGYGSPEQTYTGKVWQSGKKQNGLMTVITPNCLKVI